MHARRFTQSLVFRLILAGVILVVLGAGIRFFVLTKFIREDISKVVAEQQFALANYVARDIGHQILLRKSRLQQLAAIIATSPADPATALNQALTALNPFEALFSGGLLLVNHDGDTVVDTKRFEPQALPAGFAQELAQAGVNQATPHVGRPLKIAGKAVAVVPITIAVAEPGQAPWAFLTGFTYLYSPNFLGNILQARLGHTGSGFLVISPTEKLVIAASNPAKVLTDTPPEGVNLLHDRAMNGYRGTGITVNAHGIEEISAMVSVPNTHWFVVSAIATSEALGTVQRVKTYLLYNTLLTIGLLIIVLSVIITLQLRPLTVATRLADQMSKGEAQLLPLPGAGTGEIGVLIGAFNRLLCKLDQQQSELKNAANHDTLTGLANRRLLTEQLTEALASACRENKAVALVFVDLDRFKPINDTLGHEAGDQVLGLVARRLVHQVRDSDCVARLGGDEFVILLTGLNRATALVDTEKIITGLIQAVSQSPYNVVGKQCSLGVSTGAVISDGTHTPMQLMRWADQLMYQAKADIGRRSVIRLAQDMQQSERIG